MRSQSLNTTLLLTVLFTTTLSGCGSWWLPRAHKIEIQQGNVLPDEDVARIAEGMSRNEVSKILGEPVINNAGMNDRWDYVYSINRSGDSPDSKRLTLLFENDQIVGIEKDGFE